MRTQRSLLSNPLTRITTCMDPVKMALDYNDPVVGEELATIQPMTFEEVEEELLLSGVRAPPTMNEMDIKLMLVELRLRNSGRMSDKAEEKPRPTTFSSKFEEALYTKPLFEEFYNQLKSQGDMNAMNVAAEYVNNPEQAQARYGGEAYGDLLAQIEITLNAALPVKTPTVSFSGFPANMGEAGCKMTLEALGTIVDFECTASEDFPILTGKVTFEDIESAKKAIEQYNGMDMGMGTAIEIVSV